MTDTDALVARLRAIGSDRDVVNGRARGPMGYATSRELEAVSKAYVAAINILPEAADLIARQAGEIARLREVLWQLFTEADQCSHAFNTGMLDAVLETARAALTRKDQA